MNLCGRTELTSDSVSLTKVAKKTRENKNQLLAEVCTLRNLPRHVMLIGLGARKCRQMAVLLVVRGGEHAEFPSEDRTKTMERVRLSVSLPLMLHLTHHTCTSSPVHPSVVPHGYSSAVGQSRRKHSARPPKKSTDPACTSSPNKSKAKSGSSSPTRPQKRYSSGSQTSNSPTSRARATAPHAPSSSPPAPSCSSTRSHLSRSRTTRSRS